METTAPSLQLIQTTTNIREIEEYLQQIILREESVGLSIRNSIKSCEELEERLDFIQDIPYGSFVTSPILNSLGHD